MKRMLSVILALTLVLSVCLPCLAEGDDVGNPAAENVDAGGDAGDSEKSGSGSGESGGGSGGSESGEGGSGGSGGSEGGGSEGGGGEGGSGGGEGGSGGGEGGGEGEGGSGGSEGGGSGEGGSGGSEGGGSEGGSGGESGGGGEGGSGSEGGGEQGGGSEPTTQPTTEPTTAPTTQPPTPTYPGLPVVTKDPTSETVQEGGFAEFVARANYCTSIIWHLQSPGGGTDVLAKNAPVRFPGLVVTGLETERLGLDHIPMELNEWRVRAEFVGYNGNVWSAAAVINVMNQELEAPTIQTQPQSANLRAGESVTLQVSARPSQQDTTLTYQWYRNTTNSNVGGKAILGATSASYTPDYAQGTAYYYCAVRSTNGTEISAATKTSCAAVTYPAAAQTTEPTAQSVTQPTSSATLVPWNETTEPATLPTVTDSGPAPTRSNTLLVVIVIVIVVIAVLGILAAVLILRFYSDRDEPQEPVEIPRAVRRPSRQEPGKEPGKEPRKEPGKESEKEPWQEVAGDDEWDDLSDLGDLSIYLDGEDDYL